ncbi:MAG: CD225/dispanin family protein [Pseudomonadota bacterium]
MPPDQQPPPMPAPESGHVPTHLAWSILVTLFCCLPIGIAAIIHSTKVNKRLALGDYQGARRASGQARTLCLVSLSGLVVWFLLAVMYVAILEPYMATYPQYLQRGRDAGAKAELMKLAAAQEKYKHENNRYAAGLRELAGRYEPGEGVIIRITYADQNGWQGEARYKKSRRLFRYDSLAGGLQD